MGHVSNLLEQFPNSVVLLNIKGGLLAELGSLGEAIVVFKKIIAIHPDGADAYNNIANILKVTGQNQAALEAYQMAILKKPNFPEA